MTLLIGMVLFTLAPLIVLAAFSVNDFPYFSFPFRGLTFRWYSQLFADQQIGPSLEVSLQIALATALIAVPLGASFALGAARARSPRLRAFLMLGFLPLVTPTLIIAVGMEVLFVRTGLPLSRTTVIIGNATAFTPFVILVVTARLANFDWPLVHAARDLGAGPWQAFRTAVLPTLRPALISGLLISFLMSFNNFVIGFFLSRGFITLPSLIYSMNQTGVLPEVVSYSTGLVVAAFVTALTARRVLLNVTKHRGEIHV
jgi:spermidine/putrescine transport system permease protein